MIPTRHQITRNWLRLWLLCLAAFNPQFTVRADDAKVDLPTRRIFVPAEDLDVVIERDKKGVLLPAADLKKLIELAEKNPALKNPPPSAQLLSNAQYSGRIVGDHLLLTVTAELQQLVSGWQAWSFPLQRLAVEKATLDGEVAFVGRKDDGTLTLLTSAKGAHTLQLELSTEIVTLGSDQAIAFALLGSPAGELTLTLPAGKRLLLDGLQRERPTPIDQPAEYKVAVGGRPSLQLRITDRATDRKADALVFATTGYGLFVTPGEVTWHALTSLQVFGRPIDRVVCSVPGYLEVADVEATGLESWQLSDDPANPQRTLITLTFGQPLDGSRKISFRGVMPAPAGTPWVVPPLTIVDATSHVGQVVLQYPVGVRLQILELDGVRRATVGQKSIMDMPSDMLRANAAETLRFDAWQENFTLRCLTQPKPRELHAAIAMVLDVASSGLSMQAALTLTPRFAPLFDVDVQLPAEWSVVNAIGPDGQPLKWETIPQAAGTAQFRFTLRQPIASGAEGVLKLELRREVEGWPVEAEPIAFPLPELVMPQATLAETAIVVRGDNDLDLVAEEFVGLDPAPLKAEWERLRFQSQDTRYSGRIKTIRKPARLSAEIIGIYRLDPQTLHTELFAQLMVDGGGTRRITVTLPEAVGADVRFEMSGLVEQQPLTVENGRRRWRLQLAERLQGAAILSTRFEMPRPVDAPISAPILQVEDTDRLFGALVLEAGPEQQLTMVATDAQDLPLVETDPLDLPPVPYQPKERIIAAYRMVSTGAKLAVSEQRFDKSAVPTAVCLELLVSSIISKTGELQQKAEFQVQLAGVPQLRVTMPDGATLWAALVNQQPVEVRRQGEAYVLPIASASGGAIDATVTLFYRSQVAALQTSGTFRQSPPQLQAVSGQGQQETMEVLQQRWDIIHPEETLLVDSRGRLEPTGVLDQPGWLAGLKAVVRVPTWSSAGWSVFLIIVTAGVLAFLLLLYQRRGSRGLAEALGVVCGLGVLALCLLPYTIGGQAREAASKYSRDAYPAGTIAGLAPAPTAAPTSTPMPVALEGVSSNDMDFAQRVDAPARAKEKGDSLRQDLAKSEERLEAKQEMLSELEAVTKDAKPNAPAPAKPNLFPPADRAAAVQEKAPMEADRDELVEFAVRQPVSKAAQGKGLLSLSLVLEQPAHSRTKSFRYVGAAESNSGDALELDYIDQQAGSVWRLLLLTLGLFAGWITRKRPMSLRVMVLALLLAISLGLSPIAPVTWQVTLDGLFGLACGAALSWTLYGIVTRCQALCRGCCRWGCATLLFAVTISGASTASAQEAATKAPVPPLLQRPALVVPFNAEQDPQTAERVLLPYEKFVELYQLAHPEKELAPPPEAGRIVAALYRAELVVPEKQPEAASVKINARLVVRSYVDGQWPVVLPFQGVALNSAKLDDKSAAIKVDGRQLTLLVPSAGLHVLDVEFALPAKVLGTTGSFQLSLSATPAAQLVFGLPTANLAARVNGSTTAYRRIIDGDKARIELPVDRGGDLQVSWQPEQTREGGAAVIHVESVTAVSVADAGVTVSAGFKYRVRQGIVRDVAFSLPEGVKLQGVAGPDVGGWELVGEGAQRRLRVFLRRNVGDTTELTIDTYLPHRVQATASTLSVMEIASLEVTAEVGHVAVYADPHFSLRPEGVTGLAQVDASNYQPTVPVTRIDAAPQLVYRFSRRPWTLSLTTSRLASQLQVTQLQGQRITDRKLETTTRLVCDLAVVPRSALELHVPANWVVMDVQSQGLKDWFLNSTDKGSILTLEYDQPRQGLLEIVVLTTQSRDPAVPSVALGTLSVVGAVRTQRQAAVWLDTGLNAQISSIEKWRTIDTAALDPHFHHLQPAAAQLAFESNQLEPGEVTLTLNRAVPRVLAESLTSITVTDVAVVYGFVFQWKVDQATTDRLLLDTPGEFQGKLNFQGANLRDVATTALPGGRVRWTIALRTPVMGDFKLTAAATLPPQTATIIAPGLTFVGTDAAAAPLETQRHYALLVNTSLSQLTATDPAAREPVQRTDLAIVVRKELVDQATEFVRVKTPGTGLAWTVQRHTVTAGIPASVNLADLTMLLARDGTYRAVAEYTIKNRSRQFLAVKLPAESRLLSVFVGDQPSRTVLTKLKEQPVHLVALPKTSAADLSFKVTMTLSGRLAKALPLGSSVMGRDLDLPAPSVVGQDESDTFGIPVARTRWTVSLPDDLDAWPLRDPKRNNLNDQAPQVAESFGTRALLQDYAELLSSYDSLGSSRTKAVARNNLRNLEQQLQQDKNVNDGRDSGLQDEYRKLQSRVQMLNDDEQKQSAQEQSGTILVNPEGRAQTQDVQAQFGNAITNNSALFFDNGGQGLADINGNGIVDQEQAKPGFNFTIIQSQPATANQPQAEQAAQQAQNALKSSGNLDARNAYRARNEDQLSNLNREIAGKKVQQQFSQQANPEFKSRANQGQQWQALPGQTPLGQTNPATSDLNANRFAAPQNAPWGRRGNAPAVSGSGDMVFGTNAVPQNAAGFGVNGAFGGGMGGLGGGGILAADDNILNAWADGGGQQAALGGEWKQTGGLSLAMPLPTNGQKLVFAKSGGDARLALVVRPRRVLSLTLGLIWALACFALTAVFLGSTRSPRARKVVPLMIGVLAAIGMIVLTGPLSVLAFVIFLTAAIRLTWLSRSTVAV